MKRLVLSFFAGTVVLILGAGDSRSNAQHRQQMGGRPGEFHFILKEQADHNRAEFREMETRLGRMRADVVAISADDATRQRMLNDLDQLGLFVSSMEAQLATPAGQTAGEVEQRLNYAKGQMACGVCHGGPARGTE